MRLWQAWALVALWPFVGLLVLLVPFMLLFGPVGVIHAYAGLFISAPVALAITLVVMVAGHYLAKGHGAARLVVFAAAILLTVPLAIIINFPDARADRVDAFNLFFVVALFGAPGAVLTAVALRYWPVTLPPRLPKRRPVAP